MAQSTIQTLAALRSAALDRNEALELRHTRTDDWTAYELTLASRNWSRQSTGLAHAIMAEAPVDAADMLSLLLVVSEEFEAELFMSDDAPASGPAKATCERLRIALTNCIVALGKAVPPATSLEEDTLRCVGKQQQWWLPAEANAAAELAA